MAEIIKESRVNKENNNSKISSFIGMLFSFNTGLKLHHWNITGGMSYARHIALDQALEDLLDIIDRIVETSIAKLGSLNLVVPETNNPVDIIAYCEGMYRYIDSQRLIFEEIFEQAIIDDYQEAIQQLLYRLKRLQ